MKNKKILAIITVCLFIFTGMLRSQPVSGDSWEKLIDVKKGNLSESSDSVIIETSGAVKFHVFRVTNPPRLVVEMVDTVHDWSGKELEIGGKFIKRVRSGQYKGEPVKITRVVLDMNRDDYFYEEVSTAKQITISAGSSKEGIEKLRARDVTDKKLAKKRGLSLDPNVPTDEHQKMVQKIIEQDKERQRKLKKRLAEIEKIKSGMEQAKQTEEADSSDPLGFLSDEPVDFNFKDADILEVLSAFALKFDVNIIPDSNVSGKLTLKLKKVPFKDAFKLILDRMGLVAIKRSSNIIEIVSESAIPTQRRNFSIKNRSAGEVKTTVESLFTSAETSATNISVDTVSNSLIATSTPEILSKIESIIHQIDIKAPQIKIKARLIEVQANDSVSLGVTWANTIQLSSNQEMRAVKDMSNYALDSTTYDIDKNETIQGFSTGGVLDISAVMGDVELYGLLNFLQSSGESKTISEPTVIAENNKSSKIHVGRNLPVLTQEVTTTGTTQSVEFISEGVDLNVTPSVSSGSDLISLSVDVSVSELQGFQADNPITTERSAKTEVTVESGKTIVIGGLIRERVTKNNSGIPLLKDIPLLGYLFKNKTSQRERNELLIFLTPEILID